MPFFSRKQTVKSFYVKEAGKELGSGNFAKVYKAKVKEAAGRTVEGPERAETLPKDFPVALKEIDKAKVEDMGDIERETEVMKMIAHPNIIRLYEIFDEPKKCILVMELVTGGELFDEIVTRGNYTEKDAAGVLGTLCDALHYLHQKNIVHRDLKPENILLSHPKTAECPNPTIKVADFGLARMISDKDMMKTACGTPGYVAPEILKNKGYDSGAVDNWSAGVILYILLCGFPPFYEEELPALFDSILKARYDFPSPWWDNISAEAKRVVKSLLTVDPKKRATAHQILTDPWVGGAAPDISLRGATENLRKYQATRKLKAAAAKIMAMRAAANKSIASLATAAAAQKASE